jgi:hypothetical protein
LGPVTLYSGSIAQWTANEQVELSTTLLQEKMQMTNTVYQESLYYISYKKYLSTVRMSKIFNPIPEKLIKGLSARKQKEEWKTHLVNLLRMI